jgi:putative transposase
VVALQEQFGVSERRACTVVDQPRSTQRLTPPVPADDDLALRAWLRRRPRWGWRRAAVEAKKAGWRTNHKRIHRLWVAEGLRVPYSKRKKPLRGIGGHVPDPAQRHLGMDFQFDQTSDGRMLEFSNVVDEFTREALATDVERSIDADGVVRCLEHLNGHQFDCLLEAKVLTEDSRMDYNMHSAHGWLTPAEFVEAWLHRQAHQLA